MGKIIRELNSSNIKLNITAIFTHDQIKKILPIVKNTNAILSVFAGRIADTGKDPIPIMNDCLKAMKNNPKSELLWASSRELLNIIQAELIGCHIITVGKDIINKLKLINYDLKEYSLDTVKKFHKDAVEANFII